jgi:hypothetical protein
VGGERFTYTVALFFFFPRRDFGEALRVTARAKARFSEDGWEGVYARGRRLVAESVESGVTCMRAHVEVDVGVGMGCVRVGRRLVREWKEICEVQLCGAWVFYIYIYTYIRWMEWEISFFW